VRIPKGMILEGDPGNGKTMLAKGFAGEANVAFIAVSGSQFQEKYVGVGSSRIRELFELAKKNVPCIVFIDEIDALGRKRSGDGESSSSERDSTLNELLVALDGFKSNTGIFLMGATNRADLLDSALTRPGRIDKKITINFPDSSTREEILKIHLKGKPYNLEKICLSDLVEMTAGFSGAQIENILNEAMLRSLRENRQIIENADLENVIGKMLVGWQPSEHFLSKDMIDRIVVHEMGHTVIGFLSKYHSKLKKVVINLSSPKSPGYTMFENNNAPLHTKEGLFEHLMILLAGRIAEELFFNFSTTTGCSDDLNKAGELAESMIVDYGMGKSTIYPRSSDKYKEMVDFEVAELIEEANQMTRFIIENCRDVIKYCSCILKTEKILKIEELTEIIEEKFPDVLDFKL
jgi:cell division protease FtsH